MESFRQYQSSSKFSSINLENQGQYLSSRFSESPELVGNKQLKVVNKQFVSVKTLSQQKQKSDSPIPKKYCRESKPKIDLFRNPSAIYLSRKQLCFEKNYSEISPEKILYKTPVKQPGHTKAKSLQVSENVQNSVKKIPTTLTPMKSFKQLSPGLRKKQSAFIKQVHCDALKKIANFCDSSINDCPKIEIQEKSVMKKYTNDINWLASVTKFYSKYDPKIAKELILFSDNSRKELDKERKKIVSLIKSGDFDPNINVFKLRVIKKKTPEF